MEEVPREDGVAARRLAFGALLLALAVLALRFLSIARSAFSYDEATYVELAGHPWKSSFYPDPVFLRHPPLFFAFLSSWTALGGSSEAIVRVPSFLAAAGGTVFAWDAVRRRAGNATAALAGALLASSFVLLVYAVQATMYPFAFACVSMAAWAEATGRVRLERAAVALLPLVHLFGFLVLSIWIWRRRPIGRAEAYVALPGALWLGAAVITVVVTRSPAGPSMGPFWQALRVFALAYEGFVQPGGLVLHALGLILFALVLGPVSLWLLWRRRELWSSWDWITGGLVLALVAAPSFLRYALLPLPLLLRSAAGPTTHTGRRLAVLSLVFSFLAAGAGAAFVSGSVDTRAANDVPAFIDWRAVADDVAARAMPSVVTPSPTALAYYLGLRHHAIVTDATQGPGRLVLSLPGGALEVREMPATASLSALQKDTALFVVPDSWQAVRSALDVAGYRTCGQVAGATLLRGAATGC